MKVNFCFSLGPRDRSVIGNNNGNSTTNLLSRPAIIRIYIFGKDRKSCGSKQDEIDGTNNAMPKHILNWSDPCRHQTRYIFLRLSVCQSVWPDQGGLFAENLKKEDEDFLRRPI